MKNFILLVGILACLQIKAQPQQFSSSPFLDSIIQQKMASGHVPGISACIVKDEHIRWIGTYGQAYFDPDILVDTSTLFMLASVSKTTTVTALMQLWEDGLFDLDDDINDYLPFEIHNPYYPDDTITFRMLCTHTSAIKDNWDLMTYYWGMDSPIPLGQYLYDYMHPDGANYSPGLNYFNLKPGTSFNYCNNAVALLGYLIEVIGDSTFSYQTQKGIFEPLEMNETSWFISELDSMNFAMPYHWNTTTYVPYGHFSYSDYPAGALRTSVDQLAKFLMCYMEVGTYQGQQILQGSTIEMILTPQVPQINPNIGLIWFRSSSGNRDLWGHTGGDIGVRTLFSFCQDENTGVVILTNGENNNTNEQIEDVLYQYAEDSIITTLTVELYSELNTIKVDLSPNPFHTNTTLTYTLDKPGNVQFTVYNLQSQVVFMMQEKQEKGEQHVQWNAEGLPAGMYYLRIQAGERLGSGEIIKME